MSNKPSAITAALGVGLLALPVGLPLALVTGLAVAWFLTGAGALAWTISAATVVAAIRSVKAEAAEQEAFGKDLLAVMNGQKPTGPLANFPVSQP
jgi:uncharacterized membrane protein